MGYDAIIIIMCYICLISRRIRQEEDPAHVPWHPVVPHLHVHMYVFEQQCTLLCLQHKLEPHPEIISCWSNAQWNCSNSDTLGTGKIYFSTRCFDFLALHTCIWTSMMKSANRASACALIYIHVYNLSRLGVRDSLTLDKSPFAAVYNL